MKYKNILNSFMCSSKHTIKTNLQNKNRTRNYFLILNLSLFSELKKQRIFYIFPEKPRTENDVL